MNDNIGFENLNLPLINIINSQLSKNIMDKLFDVLKTVTTKGFNLSKPTENAYLIKQIRYKINGEKEGVNLEILIFGSYNAKDFESKVLISENNVLQIYLFWSDEK